jgi:hypothetical protein
MVYIIFNAYTSVFAQTDQSEINEKGPGKTGASILLATLNHGQLKLNRCRRLLLCRYRHRLMLHTEKHHYLHVPFTE